MQESEPGFPPLQLLPLPPRLSPLPAKQQEHLLRQEQNQFKQHSSKELTPLPPS